MRTNHFYQKEATKYHSLLTKELKKSKHETVMEKIHDETQVPREGFTIASCMSGIITCIALFVGALWDTAPENRFWVWNPAWTGILLLIAQIGLLVKLTKSEPLNCKSIWASGGGLPIIGLIYAIWWACKYQEFMYKEMRNDRAHRALDSIQSNLASTSPQALITLKQMYSERKYEEMAEEINGRVQRTERAVSALLDPASPFREAEFVTRIVTGLEQQKSQLKDQLEYVVERKEAVSQSLQAQKKQLEDLERFRDIITGAELMKDNEMFLSEYESKLKAITDSAERMVLSTNKDMLTTRSLIKSLPEIQTLYNG